MLVNEWVWLRSRVCLLSLEVHLGSELRQKQRYGALKAFIISPTRVNVLESMGTPCSCMQFLGQVTWNLYKCYKSHPLHLMCNEIDGKMSPQYQSILKKESLVCCCWHSPCRAHFWQDSERVFDSRECWLLLASWVGVVEVMSLLKTGSALVFRAPTETRCEVISAKATTNQIVALLSFLSTLKAGLNLLSVTRKYARILQ